MTSEWKTRAKAQHQCIKLEDMKEKIKYAFSFNPKPEYTVDHTNKMKLVIKHMTELVRTLNYSQVDVVIEASPSGRLHYHGIITITDIARFVLFDMPKLQAGGTYEIDTIDTKTDYWNKYCSKQRHIWEPYILSLNLPAAYQYNIKTYV